MTKIVCGVVAAGLLRCGDVEKEAAPVSSSAGGHQEGHRSRCLVMADRANFEERAKLTVTNIMQALNQGESGSGTATLWRESGVSTSSVVTTDHATMGGQWGPRLERTHT